MVLEFIEQIVSLLIIINPFASISLYLGLSDNYSNLRHQVTQWRIVKKMFILLLTFFFIGSWVLTFYGLSIDNIRVTGGILLFMSSWKILNKRQEHEKLMNTKKQDISFFPMAMPMLAGPSAIAYIIQLNTSGDLNNWLFILQTIGALIVVSGIVYLVLYLSKWIKFIGDGGLLAMNKLMGFFTLGLAIKMIETGLKGMFNLF